VIGYDHDGDILNELTPLEYPSTPNSYAGWEWNIATFSLDLSKSPASGTEYFTRRSMEPGFTWRGVSLMFEVSGRIEISNP